MCYSFVIRHLWKRIQRFGKEMDEVWVLVCTLPLCYTDLRAGLLKRLTASDASEWGGGLCVTQGVSRLGELRSSLPPSLTYSPRIGPFIAIEWFAGIGGLGRALARWRLFPIHTVVCEHCLHMLRQACPGATVWKDILKVTRKRIREVLDAHPEMSGPV